MLQKEIPVQIQCSLYRRTDGVGHSNVMVYNHCNCGNRMEVQGGDIHEQALDRGYSVFTYDFANCGMSQDITDGQVTLGYQEQYDL